MASDVLTWQMDHIARAKETLARYDLGVAARAASAKGAALSLDEMDHYRVDASTTILPRRVLVFDGDHYSFA
jgi:hypothetical protein